MAKPHWWQSAVIYQIYPRSFQDTDDDGVGDLAGITTRLPYLHELGIDAIWLAPIFRSPMADFGYDISDYRDVDPLFGTLEDLDRLIDAAHRLGLKVLLDLVPNHTSEQHPWFVESRASRDNPRRDWYIWRDPTPDGGPPNNWLSEFGGSAWTLDAATGQYFHHAFLAAQPDLNWRNPQVRSAMHDVMRFWLRRGVDGFRVDVIWHLIKDEKFRDNPPNPDYRDGMPPHQRLLPLYSADRPGVHEVISELRQVVDEFDDRLLIGEIYLPIERLVAYYGQGLRGVHLPFNFSLIEAAWRGPEIARLVRAYEAALPPGGWPNWVLSNHDRARVATRAGPAQARVAAMLLMTLRGTPTIYYGDEIGMEQVPIARELVRDPYERNVPGLGLGRDGARTPMQWDATARAGFSRVAPWLPLAADASRINVAFERADLGSLYHLYRRLIRARRAHPALSLGSIGAVAATGDVLRLVREHDGLRILVMLNLGHAPAVIGVDGLRGRVLVASRTERDGEAIDGTVTLDADDGVVIALEEEARIPDRADNFDAAKSPRRK